MRRAARRDAAEPEIVKALRAVGALVKHLNDPDIGDLLIAYRGKWYVAEVKTGNAKRRPGQIKFATDAEGAGVSTPVLRSVDDALQMIQGAK